MFAPGPPANRNNYFNGRVFRLKRNKVFKVNVIGFAIVQPRAVIFYINKSIVIWVSAAYVNRICMYYPAVPANITDNYFFTRRRLPAGFTGRSMQASNNCLKISAALAIIFTSFIIYLILLWL